MVEVFKTNVKRVRDANQLLTKIRGHFPDSKTNFDLSDCDRILRIEGENIVPEKIIELLNDDNYECMILD